jgi:glycosyltransferase involved in cell wall biosynthesis
MRIALFCGDLSGAGGAERVILEEADALRAAGHIVRVVSFDFSESVTFSQRYDEQVVVLERKGGGAGARLVNEVVAMHGFLRSWSPDIVIAASANDCSRLFLPAMLTRTRYITYINGTQFWFTSDQDVTKYSWLHRRALQEVLEISPWHRQFVDVARPRLGWRRRAQIELSGVFHLLAVRHADVRIAFSRRMAWEIELIYGRPAMGLKGAVPEEMLRHLPATDPTAAHRRHGGPLVLNVNRLEPRKRVLLTIEAFALVLDELPDAVLVIGGTGPSEAGLRAVVDERGLGGSIRFLGFIEEHELWDWLGTCDVFVHPNWAEFAIAPYEALALGANVVWSSEMEVDDFMVDYPHLFPAEPEPQATAAAIIAAAGADRASVEERQIFHEVTWERYFATIGTIVDDVVRRG